MEGKLPKTQYYVWSATHWWTKMSIIVSICAFLVATYRAAFKYDDFFFIIATIIFLLGILCSLIVPTLHNRRAIDNAYKGHLLWDALEIFLEHKDYHEESNNLNNDNQYKYVQLLKEACELPFIRANLNLDGKPFDEFFNMQGAISVTDASIFAWKYPEYSWFLTSQYAASLFKQGDTNKGKNLIIKDRKNEAGGMVKQFKTHLTKLYKSSFEYKGFTRIYLINMDDFNNYRSMLEQFVAGHTLFGINIYILNKDEFLKDSKRKELYYNMIESILKTKMSDMPINKRYLDIMCYMKKNNDNDIFYTDIDSSTHDIVELDLKNSKESLKPIDNPLQNWEYLIKSIKGILDSDQMRESIILYPTKEFKYIKGDYLLNEKKSVLLFN